MPARPDGDGRNVHGRDGGGDGGGDAHGSDGGGDGGGDNRGRGDSTAALQLPAPGKINRYLRVLGRREDGFHEIETQFQFIAWADRLTFEALDSPQIRRIDRHDFALPAEDLCVRAARLLQAECPTAAGRGALITARKTIPPGSGLGGGSSNAATTLLALNRLWQLGLPRDRLAELGLRLGADVPLFVRGRAALARGIGEKLTPQTPAEKYLCICIPAAVSTARVFAEFRPADCGNRDNSGSGDAAGRGDNSGNSGNLDNSSDHGESDAAAPTGNDLESAATRLYPAIGDALAQLRSRGMNAHLTGSGGAIFAEFNSRAEANRAAAALPNHLPARVTPTLNRHPLADFGIRP